MRVGLNSSRFGGVPCGLLMEDTLEGGFKRDVQEIRAGGRSS